MDALPPDFSFSAKDRHGVEHAYTGRFHGPEEGLDIMAEFIQAGVSTIGGIRLGFATFGGQAPGAPQAMGKIVRKVLAHTTRDGALLGVAGAYDAAYRGNPLESLAAFGEVVSANGFLPQWNGTEIDLKTIWTELRTIRGSPPPSGAPPASASPGSTG